MLWNSSFRWDYTIGAGSWNQTRGLVRVQPKLTAKQFLLAWLFSRTNDNHAIRQIEKPASEKAIVIDPDPASVEQQQSRAFNERVRTWLNAHSNRGIDATSKPCPVIFVAAEGGGIRAAYWTALVLGELDAASHGFFWDHLFAISGVSGGSLGATSYMLARQANNTSGAIQKSVRDFLSKDYLSPVLSGLFFGGAGKYYCVSGKVNSEDKLYLVIESVKKDTKHHRDSAVPAAADGAGGSVMES